MLLSKFNTHFLSYTYPRLFTQGFTAFSIRPRRVSLLCDTQPETIQVYNHCPPYRSNGQLLPISLNSFLYDDVGKYSHDMGLEAVHILPVSGRGEE